MNTKKTITSGIIIIIILFIINLTFIWLNSFMSSSLSYAISRKFSGVIRIFFDPYSAISSAMLSGIIRKSAHFIEFFLFGAEITLFHKITKKLRISTMLLIFLSVAVIDESIQVISNRTDSVIDIIIDFGGAVSGMLVIFIVFSTAAFIVNKMKQRG